MSVFDMECDGLYPTKIYVLSYQDGDEVKSLTTHDSMKSWLLNQSVLVGHNITLFDVPHLERVLNIKIKARLIDTLALSWYLYPEKKIHGLDAWGKELGVAKPYIADWNSLSLAEYVNRCQEDVKINTLLYDKQLLYLRQLYNSDNPQDLPIVRYLQFKMETAREQERSKWRLDREWCETALQKLWDEQQPRIDTLKGVMPPVIKQVLKQPPAKPYKKDGTYSVEGAKWQKYLSERGLTKTHTAPIYVDLKEEPPNPNSPEQIKNWLYGLGWVPETFKYEKDDNGAERKIPQIKIPQSPDICPSVLELADKEPAIEALEGLSVVKHRIGILQGFLNNVDDEGFLKARIQGFTNTLRVRHTEVVNLPGVDKPWGKEVRGCLVAREGYELCGSDMVSLEDTTKKHYMFDYDPDYVEEMSQPGFDSHMDLAVRAGAITKQQMEAHKAKLEDHGPVRKVYKVVNYSGIYGIGPPKLARALKSSVSFAKGLLKSYWERNWSVVKIAEDCVVKTVNGQMWLLNPVSKFWYSLRYEKDRFSTLNQGTGVFCFDTWLSFVLKARRQLTATFHDEGCWEIKLGNRDKMTALLQDAIDATNDKLKLNVKLAIDTHYGSRYSEVHG